MTECEDFSRWLVLVHQFPKGPDSLRVKIWRRLQAVGALAVKNSVYLLPLNDQTREDFAWLLTELRDGGADGVILESRLVDGMSDQQARDLFNSARNHDYDVLANEIEQVTSGLPEGNSMCDHDAIQRARRVLERARNRIAEIESIDFFGATGHDAIKTAIRALNEQTEYRNAGEFAEVHPAGVDSMENLKNRVWVTRRGVRVDRIASAWLIRRWIDTSATFKFVGSKAYSPKNGEVRFDMFEAEFTHEGDLCTFEVLTRLARPDDRALQVVGEIVHDIDLKDSKFARPETPGVATLLNGVVARYDDDEQRIDRGSQLFDDHYQSVIDVTP
jgi:hypothetical protein